MAKITARNDIQITALADREKTTLRDLTTPGPGTPWEDRGSGLVIALVRTCVMSMTRPTTLWQSMRRLDTKDDARSFAIACAIMWALSALIHWGIATWSAVHAMKNPEIHWPIMAAQGLALALLIPVFALWVLRLCVQAYFRMAAAELRPSPPDSLVYNVLAYALGPSLLAPIPFYIGPAIAMVWIAVLFTQAGIKRLYIKRSASIINACLTLTLGLLVTAVALAAAWLACHFIPAYEQFV